MLKKNTFVNYFFDPAFFGSLFPVLFVITQICISREFLKNLISMNPKYLPENLLLGFGLILIFYWKTILFSSVFGTILLTLFEKSEKTKKATKILLNLLIVFPFSLLMLFSLWFTTNIIIVLLGLLS